MKVFLSSTYFDLTEHRIIPAGDKAAHDALEPIDLTGFTAARLNRSICKSESTRLTRTPWKPVRSGTQGWEK